MKAGSTDRDFDELALEVIELRRAARRRALKRPVEPFTGTISDETLDAVPVRRYLPAAVGARDDEAAQHAGTSIIFLHGGYGVFGDLDLQDGWCRRLADGWGCEVLAVDYPLAPENTLSDSVAAVGLAVDAAAPQHIILCGDSAGAGLALAAASTRMWPGRRLQGVLLTNPNIDLSLQRFDADATGGPDMALSARAFNSWTRRWTHSPDLVTHAAALPATFVAVGRRDALLPEAEDLVHALAAFERPYELATYDAGHGFLTDAAISGDVIARSRRFFR